MYGSPRARKPGDQDPGPDALSAYAGLRVRLAEELGIDPSPDLRRLQERILRQDPALDWHRGEASGAAGRERVPVRGSGGGAESRAGTDEVASHPGVLPAPRLPTEATSFVGREAELNTIAELLGLSRLVTLTGPGGSGKSRLALRAAAQAAGDFSDGGTAG
jgi:Bacterial transcriptional activator domain